MMGLSGFLLCAGLGERFYPQTRDWPKPLLPFLNVPLSAYNLYLLKNLGVTQCFANTYAHPRILKQELYRQAQTLNLPAPILSLETKLLGSAGGLLKLEPVLKNKGHFFYLNGDSMILPDKMESLKDLYHSHIESGALATFLVGPQNLNEPGGVKKKKFIQADTTGQVCSFSASLKLNRVDCNNSTGGSGRGVSRAGLSHVDCNNSTGGNGMYDFSGLAVFSCQIFKHIRANAAHIFQDVLKSKDLKKHCRVYFLPKLKLLDMNQLSSYLDGTEKILQTLQARTNSSCQSSSAFHASYLEILMSVWDIFSPAWARFQGENYCSAVAVPSVQAFKEGFVFCGNHVQNLKHLTVKHFAVLGDHARIVSPLTMNRSVAGTGATIQTDLREDFLLSPASFFKRGNRNNRE